MDILDGFMSFSGFNIVKKVWFLIFFSKVIINGFFGGDNEVSRRFLKWNFLVISNCCIVLGFEFYII